MSNIKHLTLPITGMTCANCVATVERNELNTAEQHLLKSKELGELNGLPKNPYRWRVAMARIQETQRDLEGALDLLDEAESLYT